MLETWGDMLEWERACGRSLPDDGPRVPDEKTLALCGNLIIEEVVKELLSALARRDLEGIADGAIDSIWVILETLFLCGVDPVPIWDAVRAANMRKFGRGSRVREDGKLLKPPDWVAPDIAAILAAQRPLAETYSRST